MSILTRHLHGGKWSQEEELYAASLMESFKAGDLDPSDCPEGALGLQYNRYDLNQHRCMS